MGDEVTDYGDPTKFVIDHIKNLGSFCIEIHFRDDKSQTIDFSSVEFEPWQQLLENIDYFNQVTINECGFLEWPQGEDFPPDHLYFWEEYRDTYKKKKEL